MTMMQMYWVTRLDYLSFSMCLVTTCIAIALLIGVIIWSVEERLTDIAKSLFRWGIPLFVVSMLITCLIPSTKDIAVIYTVPKILNNEDIQALPADLVKLSRETVEGYLKENKE